MKTYLKRNRAFSLIELMVVITIMATLMSISFPVYNGVIVKAKMMKAATNARQIVTGCQMYASDWEGLFPNYDTRAGDSTEFQTATEAFNELSRELEIANEKLFWTPGNPEKLLPPNEDGNLEPEEVSYIYVTGQTNTTAGNSPLVADEQEAPGVYGENHPWLGKGKAVVGYCGGHVEVEKLTEKSAGATVRGPAGSGIDNIFNEAQKDEDGRISNGYLAVKDANILLPQ